MRSSRMFGLTVLAVMAMIMTGILSAASVSAQAVSSLPVAIYQGTCDSDSIEHVVDLNPIVPAASVAGSTFGGSDEAIDVATSTTSLDATLSELLANAPLSIIVASGTGADATELACGVIGGFVTNNQVSFGIDDQKESGISGVATIADLGSQISVTVILGEFPMDEGSTAATQSATGNSCVAGAVAAITSPHGVGVPGDADGDNITDTDEATLGTDPNNADSDNDGISDGWEFFLGNDPLNPEDPADSGTDTSADPDQDGLTTRTEMEMGTDPANPDTDHDGVSDGAEVGSGTNPLEANC